MLDSGAHIDRQIEYYQRKYELNPHSRAFAPLADLYRKASRLEEALEVLEAGLAEHPRYVSALVIMARCQLDAGRPAEADAAFARVLELDPDNLVALKSAAEMALAAGETQRGAGLLERVVFLDPTDETAAASLGALREAGSAAPARPAARTATESPVVSAPAPEPPPPAAAAGEAPAPRPAAEAAPAAPGAERQSFATKTLAEIYLAQGYREKALTVLREILARHPERADIGEKIAEIESQPPAAAEPVPTPEPATANRPAAENRRHFEAWLDRLGKSEDQA